MRQYSKSKHNGKSALVIIILLMMIGGGFSGLYYWESTQRQREAEAAARDDPYEGGPVIIQYNGEKYQLRDDLEYYLFMGLDKTTETLSDPAVKINNQQADLLLLMVVDHSNGTYYGVHINRDTMVEIKRLGMTGENLGTYNAQICLAHAYGSGGKDSCRNQVWAVSRFFYDLPIKHYVSITMDGIPVLNDAVGGVVVHVSDDFSREDPSLVIGEDVLLRGNQVLTYVRIRKTVADGSNLNRMKRQREYINGLVQKLHASMEGSDSFAVKLADKLSEYVISDLTTDELASLSNRLKNYRFTTIYTYEGEGIVNAKNNLEFYEDEDSFRDLVIKLFYHRVLE